MYKKGSSSAGLAIVLVLIILAVGFFMASSKWKQDSPTAIDAGNGKENVKCTLYSEGIYKKEYKAGDTKILPEIVTAIAKKFDSKLCGSISSLGYVYYLSSVDDQSIIDIYKSELEKASCTADDPIVGKKNGSYSFNMHYTCKDGDGYVATDAVRNSFYVGYKTTASPAEAAASNSNANANVNANANANANMNVNANGNANSNKNSNSSATNTNSINGNSNANGNNANSKR